MTKNSKLKIKYIQVHLDDSGPDYIYLTPDCETPFPILKYPPFLKMEAQAGYGVEWVRKVFGREPDNILDFRKQKT